MQKVKEYLKHIYGLDALSCGLILLSVVINLATALLLMAGVEKARMWNILCFVPLFVCIYRCLSVNHIRRSREDQWFIRRLEPILHRRQRSARYGEGDGCGEQPERRHRTQSESQKEERKAFKFFKCPACRQKIRVPKGKGKIEITCPRCGDKFIKKT